MLIDSSQATSSNHFIDDKMNSTSSQSVKDITHYLPIPNNASASMLSMSLAEASQSETDFDCTNITPIDFIDLKESPIEQISELSPDGLDNLLEEVLLGMNRIMLHLPHLLNQDDIFSLFLLS